MTNMYVYKAHDAFMKGHKYVPFAEYRRLPQKYDKPMCVSHNQPLSLTCEVCDVLVCDECDLTSPCNNQQSKLIYKCL